MKNANFLTHIAVCTLLLFYPGWVTAAPHPATVKATVVNTQENPVPVGVAGNVNTTVVNTLINPIPVAVQNTVPVVGSVNANLLNTPENPVPVTMARQVVERVKIVLSGSTTFSGTSVRSNQPYQVTEGKRLVVEQLSCTFSLLEAGDVLACGLDGGSLTEWIPSVFNVTEESQAIHSGGAFKTFYESGVYVAGIAWWNKYNSHPNATWVIVGYLEDAPASE